MFENCAGVVTGSCCILVNPSTLSGTNLRSGVIFTTKVSIAEAAHKAGRLSTVCRCGVLGLIIIMRQVDSMDWTNRQQKLRKIGQNIGIGRVMRAVIRTLCQVNTGLFCELLVACLLP